MAQQRKPVEFTYAVAEYESYGDYWHVFDRIHGNYTGSHYRTKATATKAAKALSRKYERQYNRKSNPRSTKLTDALEQGWNVRHITTRKVAANAREREAKELVGAKTKIVKSGGRYYILYKITEDNPSSIKSKSTPWIPVKAIRFRDGKLDMKVSRTVKRSLVAGDRLGNPGRYSSMAAIKKAAKDVGSPFFDRATMKFFKSKIEGGPYQGKYFVTSEKHDEFPREYRVREAQDSGHIRGLGTYETKSEAIKAAKSM